MRRLILNADDFGLTPGVNRSIVELHAAGVLTSTTLMAASAAFTEAAELSTRTQTLGTGCHVTLLDGHAILDPGRIPSLASPEGRLRPTLAGFVSDLFRRRIKESEMEAEAIAQIRRLQQAGVRVTHLDTHKHTHIYPAVLRPLLRAALQCGVSAIRNPFEPKWSLRVTRHASLLRRMQVKILNSQRSTFLRLTQQAGLLTPQGAAGVLATGSLTADRLRALLHALPDGTWELVSHPGYADAALEKQSTRLQASRAIEHAALLREVPASRGIELIHFGQL